MDPKIRIKIGLIEIEYEGNESYLKNELPILLDKIFALKGYETDEIEKEEINSISAVEAQETTTSKSKIQMSSNSIAAKLGVKSGPDLIMVACAHLTFVQEKDTFNRSEILTEMKTASNFFKISHSKNLSAGLKSLVNSNKLIERSKDTFALTANEKSAIKTKLNA